MRRFFPALLAAALWTGGCGHVGDPMAPRANVPGKITDLAAVQRGSLIYAQFSVPPRTTEGIAIATPLTFDLRAGPGVDPFKLEQWVAQTKQFAPFAVQGGLAVYHIPIDGWAGKEILLSARAIGTNGKDAGWSAFVTVPVVPPPAVPQLAEPEATAQGVRLTWSGPPGDVRIWRQGPDEKAFSRIADVQQPPPWTDTTAEFGKHYTYLVQSIVKLAGGKEAESDQSAEVGLTPIDKFPPAAPTGLHASLAPSSIEITWQQNTESDLAGYRLYRAVGDGAFERIAEVSQIPSYSDHAVEAGKTYRYAVSAIDQSGNESDRSAPVEVTMQ
jgi:hypothetical protein